MKNKGIAFAFFILGIALFYIGSKSSSIPTNAGVIDTSPHISFYDKMKAFEGYEFFGILINNIIVGILLSILGYFTGGVLTLSILVWNGFLVALVYNLASYQLPLDKILYASKHTPFEVYAFLIFADFGLQGRFFVRRILKYKEP